MKKIIISLLFFSLFLFPVFYQAQAKNPTEGIGIDKVTSTTNISTNTFTNPIKGVKNVNQLIGKVINAIMGVVGSLALLMFVFGGLTWMTSGGSTEKVKKGKDILVWSAIGLVIIFSAYGITNLIINYTTK